MNPPRSATPLDDGLEWLREIRRRLFIETGGKFKSLGDHYRQVEARHPEKVIDPRKVVADAVRAAAVEHD